MWRLAHRTLTGYLISVSVVLAILNGIDWWRDAPQTHDVAVFSAGFLLGRSECTSRHICTAADA